VSFTPARAEFFLFRWSPGAEIEVKRNALVQTGAGVTVSARGYAVEITSDSSQVFGPFPTSRGDRDLRVFGVDLRELGSEQLGLLSQPLPGIDVAGTDLYPGGLSPGFENGPYHWGNTSVNRLEMALFRFSEPVTVRRVIVNNVSNYGQEIWAAGCRGNPDFSQGLANALTRCIVRHPPHQPGGGRANYGVGLHRTRVLLVGARPQGTVDLGKISATPYYSQFYIEAIKIER
jgi:hypothetical protein